MSQVYIHFTDLNGAIAIKNSGELWKSSYVEGIYAIAKGGLHSPKVQLTSMGRAKKRNAAVYFTTSELPDLCYPEECIWKKDKISIDVKKISLTKMAIKDLDNSIPSVGDGPWERLMIPTKEIPNLDKLPDWLLKENLDRLLNYLFS